MERNEQVYCFTKTAGRIVLSTQFHLRIVGAENIPKKSAFILLPKHQRWQDIPLLGIATPKPLYYVAKQELFSNPLGDWFFRRLGGVPLDRKRPIHSRGSLNRVFEILKQGEGLVIFPEGTYYKGKMGPGRLGMIRHILSRVSPRFIPVGIHYARGAWRTSVRIHFGKAVFGDPKGPIKTFVNDIMREIERLSRLNG